MKSTVVKVSFKKEFDTKNGTMYSWHVTMDNGDMGETSTKSDKAPWAVGNEAEYTLEETQYGNKIKKVYAQQGGGFKGGNANAGASKWTPDPEKETRKERWAKQIMITRLACLNTASGLISAGNGESSLDNLTGLAEKLETWTKRGIDLKALVAPALPTVTNEPPANYATSDSIRQGVSAPMPSKFDEPPF